MKRAISAVVVTLILGSGCSDSPVAPSTISDDGARPRVAPFRNFLDSIPDTTADKRCRDAAAPFSPTLRGVHQRRCTPAVTIGTTLPRPASIDLSPDRGAVQPR